LVEEGEGARGGEEERGDVGETVLSTRTFECIYETAASVTKKTYYMSTETYYEC
jgi:hypothetical protein